MDVKVNTELSIISLFGNKVINFFTSTTCFTQLDLLRFGYRI
jgi:hypothetical protein